MTFERKGTQNVDIFSTKHQTFELEDDAMEKR